MNDENQEVEDFVELAKKYFYDGYTWTGAVVQVAQEYIGEVDERITRMATALPGGGSLRGGTYGWGRGEMAISPEDREMIYKKMPADTIRSLNTINDVFQTVSVWEKAVALHERGLTWSQAATELISACERYPRD